MASNYDEKILASFGKRDKRGDNAGEPDQSVNGVFVVDPNKVVDSEENIKDRYVKQEDLVMYANITARLNPDTSILENEDAGRADQVINIGRVGVNMLNPLKNGVKDDEGKFQFNGYKDKLTTGWSDYFTTDQEEGTFFDPETFGISSIDVTHNASLVPIIKVQFIDVQGRTLLERGDDDSNPYNIFYRFPYPLFTLTMKGFYGKGIEYPLSLVKTDTTFDSTSGNYIINAEFLSRTFSIYNNFLLVYATIAPYMYQIDGTNDYLGKRILRGLYQKQNLKYKELYGEDSEEYRKKEFTKYPTIQDLSRGDTVLNYDSLTIIKELSELNEKKSDALNTSAQIAMAYGESYIDIESPDYNKRGTDLYMSTSFINDVINGDRNIPTLDNIDINNSVYEYISILRDIDNGVYYLEPDIIKSIITNITDPDSILPNSYVNKVKGQGVNMSDLLNDELFIVNKTTQRKKEELIQLHITYKYFNELHRIILKTISEFYETRDNQLTDNFTYKLKDKIGYVPNMSNVIRILMNNMQAFISMLNLVGLNASNQLINDYKRQDNQKVFGETVNDRFYPFPNYYEKKLEDFDYTIQKTYPGNDYTKNWYEVQFVEEIFNALDRLPKEGLDSDDEGGYEYKESIVEPNTQTSDRKFSVLSTLLVENNLDYYNVNQTPTEAYKEFLTKILAFSTLGFLNINGDNGSINEISKIMVEHEYDLLDRRLSQFSKEEKLDYENSIYYYFSNNLISNYESICSNRVTLGSYQNDNYEGVISQLKKPITNIKNLINSSYTVEEFEGVYDDIYRVIEKAVDVNEFKSIYDYEPLRYKNSRNQNGLVGIKSLFFKGLDYHDEYDGYSKSLDKLSDYLNTYRPIGGTTVDVPTLGMYSYYINEKNDTNHSGLALYGVDYSKHKPNYLDKKTYYAVDNKVASNNRNSNALALSTKTDNFFGMKPENKEVSNVRYSKINL